MASGCGTANGGPQLYPLTVHGAGTGRPGLQLVPPVRPWSRVAVCSLAYLASEHVSLGRWPSQPSPTSALVESRFLPYSRLSWVRPVVLAPAEVLWHKLRQVPPPLKSLLHPHRHRPVLPNQWFHHRSPHPARNRHRLPNRHQSRAHVAPLRIRGAITFAVGNISTARRRPFAVTSTVSPVSGPAPTAMSINALTERTATRAAGRAPARTMAVSAAPSTGLRPTPRV
jgi:hypothetical protein